LTALDSIGLGSLRCVAAAPRLACAEIRFGRRSARMPLPPGVVIDRAELDSELAARACEEGAVFLDGAAATLSNQASAACESVAIQRGGVSQSVTARVVLVADGLGGSFFRSSPEFAPAVHPHARLGVGTILSPMSHDARLGPPAGVVQMNAHADGYVGLANLCGGRLAVAAALDSRAIRDTGGPGPLAERILASCRTPCPDLADARWLGTPGLTRSRPNPARRSLLLVGDAAAYVEPFTGEGMTWALLDAIRQAERAERYLADDHRSVASPRRASTHACRVVAAVLRRPLLARAAIGALAVSPLLARVAGRVVHGGAS
jgi:2-polyprenyl-6-methoxyphenol hydroxylase-like FAD-dependent oxidoreductase